MLGGCGFGTVGCGDSVIVEAVKMDNIQKLCSTLEPLLRRVVSSSSFSSGCLHAA